MSPIPDLDEAYKHHPPTAAQASKYEALRSAAKSMAHLIAQLVPCSSEQETSQKKLREALMWANAGIACNPETPLPPAAKL